MKYCCSHYLKAIAFLILLHLVCCSDHLFDNPLDPDNAGSDNEFELMFRSPTDYPGDMTWDGYYLWLTDTKANQLLRLNPYDGSVSDVIQLSQSQPMGLTLAEDNFWVSLPETRRILELDFLTGRELFSFSSPGSGPRGLAYDKNARLLFNIDAHTLILYRLDPANGSVSETFTSPSVGPRGLTLTDDFIYIAGFTENKIFVLDRESGELIDSFNGPHLAPIGLAWEGNSLWVIDWDLQVYRMKPSFY